ncbi:MAG: T9SS type A sorting domain-containing protein [Candidatus Kapaibacterium sp.]
MKFTSKWPAIVSNNRGLIVVNVPLYADERHVGFQRLLSVDSGATWKQMEGDLPVGDTTIVNVLYINDQNDLFQTSVRYPQPHPSFAVTSLWRTTFDAEYLEPTDPVLLVDSLQSNLFVADRGGKIFRAGDGYSRLLASSNRGESWDTLYERDNWRVRLYALYVEADGSIFIGDTIVLRSTDGGYTWDSLDYYFPLSSGSGQRLVSMVHYDESNPEYDLDWHHYYGLIWSYDNGNTWKRPGGLMEYKWANSILFDAQNRMLVGTVGDGIFRSESVSSISQSEKTVGSSHLYVYPTPSTDQVTILLSLRERGMARLDIYDRLGRLIQTITDQELNLGEHRFEVQVGHLPSGSYFCRLVVNGEVYSAPLIVQ